VTITTKSRPADVAKVSEASAVEAKISSSAAPPLSAGTIGRAYERFLELPVVVVLAVLWLLGGAIIGSCLLALYLVVSAL
jgi:hypothetical protein